MVRRTPKGGKRRTSGKAATAAELKFLSQSWRRQMRGLTVCADMTDAQAALAWGTYLRLRELDADFAPNVVTMMEKVGKTLASKSFFEHCVPAEVNRAFEAVVAQRHVATELKKGVRDAN